MNPLSVLQVRILALLDREGPLSDIQIRVHLHTDLFTPVVVATADLGRRSLIKPDGSTFVIWQLTEQGRAELERANAREGVCSVTVN